MVCENCASDRSTAFKGARYCLNCGHQYGRQVTKTTIPVFQEVAIKASSKSKRPAAKVKIGSLAKKAALLALHPDVPPAHQLTTAIIASVIFLPILIWPLLGSLGTNFSQPKVQLVATIWLSAALIALLIRAWLSGAAVIGFGRALDRRHITKTLSLRLSRRAGARVLAVKLLQLVAMAAIAGVVGWLILNYSGLGWSLSSRVFTWLSIASAAILGALICTASGYAIAAILADNHRLTSAYHQAFNLSRYQVHRLLLAGTLSIGALFLPLIAVFSVFGLANWSSQASNSLLNGRPFYLVLAALILLVALLLHFALMFSQFLWLLIYQKISRN